MKRITAALLAVVMLFGFAACGEDTSVSEQLSLEEISSEITSSEEDFVAPENYYAVIEFDFGPQLRLYITNSVAIDIECLNDKGTADFGDWPNTELFGGKFFADAGELIAERAIKQGFDLTVGVYINYSGQGDRNEKIGILESVISGIKTAVDNNKGKMLVIPKIDSVELSGTEYDGLMEKFSEPELTPVTPKPPAPTDSEHTNYDAVLDYVSTWFAAYELRNNGNELIRVRVCFIPTENVYKYEYASYICSENPHPALAIEYAGKKWEFKSISNGETGYLSGSQAVLTNGEYFVVFDCIDGSLKVAEVYLMFGDFNIKTGTVFENTGEFAE